MHYRRLGKTGIKVSEFRWAPGSLLARKWTSTLHRTGALGLRAGREFF
jgi:hypothetical protein